jgi:DNA-binding CsgD family transcriptional regulator
VAHDIEAPLLERQQELAEFDSALSQAQRGLGRVVLIEAPAGLGKTSLLAAASATAARSGFVCLRARASELEHDFAYGCVRQLLEPVVARASADERDRLFGAAAAFARSLFAPASESGPTERRDASYSMLHGLYWLLSNLAEAAPVVLAIDDLHWSDEESLRFLNYLAPRLDGLQVAVFASARSGERPAVGLARLAAGPETTVLRPAPLSTEAIATLCGQALGRTVMHDFAAACRQATGGNPFYLNALLREAKDRDASPDAHDHLDIRRIGPAAVAQAVLLRLSGAPAAASALVRAVAVLGDGAGLSEAAALAEIGEQEAASAADLAIALAILRPGEGLEFAHPIIGESVYADIGPRERRAAHGRAARILATMSSSDERIAAQVAHAEPASDSEWVQLLRRVAADSARRGAPAASVAWLARALTEPPPPSVRAVVLMELGSAELRLAKPAAVDHLAAAVSALRDPRLIATAVRDLAQALTMAGAADRAVAAIESVIGVVEAEDRELALLLEAELAGHAQEASFEVRAEATRRLERYQRLEGTTAAERLVRAVLAFLQARASTSARAAVTHLERGLAGGMLLGEQERDVAGPFYLLLVGLLATDALDLAEASLEHALADARARASVPALAYAMEFRGWVWLRRGALPQAEADARAALDLLTTNEIELGVSFARALLVHALVGSGDLEAAEAALRSGPGTDIPTGLAHSDLLEARGLLRLAQGRAAEALEDLHEFGRRDELWGGANPAASRWRSHAASALAALGDKKQARRSADDDLERAAQWGTASGIGVALHSVALTEAGTASVDRLREAVAVLADSPARLEHARALVDLGAALRRGNHRADARGVLQDGIDLAERCGARGLAGRARTELRAAGGRPAKQPGTPGLTVSERRVAELAADGRSNPEIAQALFVTRKTVETHLGHVYRKLDVRGRGQLSRALAADPPTSPD